MKTKHYYQLAWSEHACELKQIREEYEPGHWPLHPGEDFKPFFKKLNYAKIDLYYEYLNIQLNYFKRIDNNYIPTIQKLNSLCEDLELLLIAYEKHVRNVRY